MCGIAGFVGIPHVRFNLVHALGRGIDTRGGHAAGFVAVDNHVTLCKRIGRWDDAHTRFIKQASSSQVCMMHARFATCGTRQERADVINAHPFPIRRKGKTVLWGAHNGVIYDADDSALANGRPYTVDSKEILELVADNDLDTLQSLNGYGVLTWVDAQSPDRIKVARLTEDSDFVAAKILGGGVAYASTWKILGDALRFAGLIAQCTYELNEIGRVYDIRHDAVYLTNRDGVKLNDWKTNYFKDTPSAWGDLLDSPDSWDRRYLADYLKGDAAE